MNYAPSSSNPDEATARDSDPEHERIRVVPNAKSLVGTLHFPADDHKDSVPSRSKPIALSPVRNRTGSNSYRVTGSIRGRQRKKVFCDLHDAEACQQLWEVERLQGAAAARPKFSWLTNEQIRKAEALFELLKGTGMDPLELGRYYLRNPPFVAPAKTFGAALGEFLAARKEHLSVAQLENYRIRGASFGEAVGNDMLLERITATDITNWLVSKRVGRKTWNGYRGDLGGMFAWFLAAPRRWINENPVSAVDRFNKRSIPPPPRKRLEVNQCRELMAYLESTEPAWCTFFAITLFAGVRPDMTNGEMFEFARCVGRDGIEPYVHDEILDLTKEITKDGKPRETVVQKNLAMWLKKYPPNPESLCPGDYKQYMAIRRKFKIPHDGLRRTAISAHIGKFGSFALAADEFGNSEGIIRDHYNRRMASEDAAAFYAIVPGGAVERRCAAAR